MNSLHLSVHLPFLVTLSPFNFVITYTKLDGESVTRKGKWTDKCHERIVKAGHACLTYFDLDADNYRMATNKITDWSIK